ncbi:hypothetical protein JW868_02155 [Candidatus Woesearchaeota archaeon]|nr:hypothetical protein [Candidatus Woesearchaeota archaeon]
MVRRKGQTWSIDLIIASVIFVLIITIFYALLSRGGNDKEKLLGDEAKHISSNIMVEAGGTNPCLFLDGNEIDRNVLSECYDPTKIQQFKQAANIKTKFCIYIEDQNGRIISVNNMTGFGDSELLVGNQPCGVAYHE